jgi:cyclopropane fatty-acyl-phospholipid synthase-like methyltransferase
MIGEDTYIMDVGCNDGLGSVLLAEVAKKVIALDIDPDAIASAKRAFANKNIVFLNEDFFKFTTGKKFDGIVSFDLVEHIYKEREHEYFEAISKNLNTNGVAIIGTPNETSKKYGSERGSIGHVNYFTHERLDEIMKKYFHSVFMFSANDELIHTGFYPMAHYLIAMGVCRKSKQYKENA